MTKSIINGVQTFRADVKAHYKPVIVDSFIDDTGEKILILSNGRETKETTYNALWNPLKGIVNWKGKGENPDKTKAWRK